MFKKSTNKNPTPVNGWRINYALDAVHKWHPPSRPPWCRKETAATRPEMPEPTMSTRPSWIASQGASKCWDGQALPMQQKNQMHHVDPLLLGSWMIHVYSYPYQLNQGVIKFLQLLKLHHRELLRSMACHLPLFPSFQGVPLTKCGVNAGDQQNVKSLQGATVAALAASTAAKKNKERVSWHCCAAREES